MNMKGLIAYNAQKKKERAAKVTCEYKYGGWSIYNEQVEFFIETECHTSTPEEELKLLHYLLNEIYN